MNAADTTPDGQARRDDLQRTVQSILDRAVASGSEKAIQLAAYLDGKLIVDAWAAPPGLSIDGRTLFPAFSTGKGIAATTIHRLVERRVLSWDYPIAHYWPEFGINGKGGITLRHVLSHTAGLPQLPPVVNTEPGNWDAICRAIAELTPLHAPGEKRHYHAVTFSWLLGEPARRATGRDFASIIADEICRPLGIEGIFFGLPESELPRVLDAQALPPPPPSPSAAPPPPDPVAASAVPAWMWPLETWINRPDVRRACIPASNGFMNARSIARHYAALIGPGVDGARLLSPATVAAMTEPAFLEADAPGATRWGLGYMLQGPPEAPASIFAHGGYGGSIGLADVGRRLAVGGVKSLMGSSAAFDAALQAIRQALPCS
jgi:CubicO group peptidase (beta-lactamase class C family)